MYTNIGNISGLWYQGYKQGVKGSLERFSLFNLLIHKTNTGHDACRIF